MPYDHGPGVEATWEEVVAYAEERYAIKKGMCRLERAKMNDLKFKYLQAKKKEYNRSCLTTGKYSLPKH